MIETMEETYPITDLCAAFDVSRAGFYCWRQRGPSERDRTDEALGAQIDVLFVRQSPHLRQPAPAPRPAAGRATPVDGTAWPGSCGVEASPDECEADAARAPRTAITWSPVRRIGWDNGKHP